MNRYYTPHFQDHLASQTDHKYNSARADAIQMESHLG